MVKKENWKRKEIYTCEICNFGYETKELAGKCEKYCKKNKSCSLEITAKAIKQ